MDDGALDRVLALVAADLPVPTVRGYPRGTPLVVTLEELAAEGELTELLLRRWQHTLGARGVETGGVESGGVGVGTASAACALLADVSSAVVAAPVLGLLRAGTGPRLGPDRVAIALDDDAPVRAVGWLTGEVAPGCRGCDLATAIARAGLLASLAPLVESVASFGLQVSVGQALVRATVTEVAGRAAPPGRR